MYKSFLELRQVELLIAIDCLRFMEKHSFVEGYSEAEHCILETLRKRMETLL